MVKKALVSTTEIDNVTMGNIMERSSSTQQTR
jgi:hypothetical protein